MKSAFALAFLFSGISFLYIIREYIPIDKIFFTYICILAILIFLPNIHTLKILKMYTKYPFINIIFVLILTLFLIISYAKLGINSQTIHLAMLLFISISLIFLPFKDLKLFYIALFFILSIVVMAAYISTSAYTLDWNIMTNNTRIYIGNTKNPNIISWMSMLVILEWGILFFKYSFFKGFWKYISIVLIYISLHMYILSFSKSSIIGIGLIIIFYIYYYRLTIFAKDQKYIKILSVIGISALLWVSFGDIVVKTVSSLLTGNIDRSVVSASVRYELFQKAFSLYSIDNLFGYGMNTFRMDSPLLQVSIDFGNLLGFVFLFVFGLYPYYIIYKRIQLPLDNINEEVVILIYLFFYPNLFFHGTPYSYYTWFPILLFYKFVYIKKIDFKGKDCK